MLSVLLAAIGVSWLWHGVQQCSPLISNGLLFSVGGNLALYCWKDPWVPTLENFTSRPRHLQVGGFLELKVKDLFCAETLEWKVDFIREICDVDSAEAIL